MTSAELTEIKSRHNKLTYIESAGRCLRNKGALGKYLCECGNEKIIRVDSVNSNKTRSCGCLRVAPSKRHGLTKTKTHVAWCNMRQRCLNKNKPGYENYGGRGIKFCKRWIKFENFYEDMGKCPDGMSLERIDVNDGYKPSNCIWAPRSIQAANKQKTIRLTVGGKTKSLSAWAKEIGIARSTLYGRVIRGWKSEHIVGVSKMKNGSAKCYIPGHAKYDEK